MLERSSTSKRSPAVVDPIRQNIPAGKFRVIRCELSDFTFSLVKDCDTKQEAFDLVDEHNRARTNKMDNVYYAHDDNGNYLRGDEVIKRELRESLVP